LIVVSNYSEQAIKTNSMIKAGKRDEIQAGGNLDQVVNHPKRHKKFPLQ
jgi:hypothetical protein